MLPYPQSLLSLFVIFTFSHFWEVFFTLSMLTAILCQAALATSTDDGVVGDDCLGTSVDHRNYRTRDTPPKPPRVEIS